VKRHPDDVRADREAKMYGRELGPHFAAEHQAALVALIVTYGDASAERLLERLREDFWSGEWERRRRQKRQLSPLRAAKMARKPRRS
jgi:hypothetical protein